MNSVTTRVYSVDFFLAILGYSLFVIMDSIAKELTNYYHVTQIIFINSISALLPILFYTQVRNSWKKIKTKNFLVNLVRAVTIIIFTPFVLTIGSVIFLKEKVSWRRYTAIFVGFIGTIIAIDPFGKEINNYVLLALLIPVFASVGHLLVKKYGQSESVYSFLIIGKLILILISGVITFELYIPMTKTDFFLNFNAGLLRGMGMIFIINSARHLPASIFANTQYIQLLIGALIGFYIFNEIPTWNIYLGNVFIIGAGIYIVLREIKLSRNIVSNSIRPTTISIKK